MFSFFRRKKKQETPAPEEAQVQETAAKVESEVVAADQCRHRTPHALAEGNAVFGRAFVAELDIDFRLGVIWLKMNGFSIRTTMLGII